MDLTITLSLAQGQFLTGVLKGIMEHDDFPDAHRKVARSIWIQMIDTAVLEGLIGADELGNLTAPEGDDHERE